MTFKVLCDRVSEGEIVPVEAINGIYPEEFIAKNSQHFRNFTVEDDWTNGGVFWIYDAVLRTTKEYNP